MSDKSVSEQAVIEQVKENPIAIFITNLNKYLASDFIKINFRNTLDGIFLKDSVLKDLLGAYHAHVKSLTGKESDKDDLKTIKKIFHSEEPSLVYLIEGKNVSIGYVIPVTGRFNFMLNFQGRTLEARTYLHPRDPIFSQISGLSTGTGATGFELAFTHKQYTYKFNLEILKQFQETSRTGILKKFFPQASRSLRQALPSFLEVLKTLRLNKAKYKLFVPTIYKQQKFKYLKWRQLVFVTEGPNIKAIYATKGKGLFTAVMTELDSQNNLRTAQRFTVFNRSRNIGAFQLTARSFELSRGALCDFIENCGTEAPTQLPAIFTLKDSIESLAKLLETADLVPLDKIPEILRPKASHSIAFYEKQDWLFMVLRKTTILSIFHRHQKNLRFKRKLRS